MKKDPSRAAQVSSSRRLPSQPSQPSLKKAPNSRPQRRAIIVSAPDQSYQAHGKRPSRTAKAALQEVDSARQQAEAAIQAAEAARAIAVWRADQLDRIFEAITDGLLIYDSDGKVVRVNAALRRLVGLDTAPPEYFKLSAPERHARFHRVDTEGNPIEPKDFPVMRALRGEDLTDANAVQSQVRTLDGRVIETSTGAAPLRDHAGHIIGAVAVIHDQTEHNRLAREREAEHVQALALREMNERLDTFFHIATHELRAPVASSRLAVQLAERRARQAAASQEQGLERESEQMTLPLAPVVAALETAERQLDQLVRLLRQLTDVTQARAGALTLDLQLRPLAAVVQASLERQRLLAPTRTLTIDLTDLPDGEPVLVLGDGDRLEQVVTNYLANALQYAPEETPIVARVRVQDGAGRVEVLDQGPGIAPVDQGRIWERYQQARTLTAGHGMGLGLYIARMIVEAHGGQVGVESALGAGATFWFTIPLAREAQEEPSVDK